MENVESVIPIKRPESQHGYTNQTVPDESYNEIPGQFIEKVKYPTEVIDLPSKGWFYPKEHLLSSGKIELKMMTAKEEDILTSQNLIKKGIVLQKLVESLIVNKKIKQEDILICDMNGMFLAIRRLAYGDQYGPLKIKCPTCGEEGDHTIDLSKIEDKTFDFEKYPKGQNLFTFTLPYSKKVVTYKILTQKEDDAIDIEIKALGKLNKERSSEITTRLKHVIQSLDGEDDKAAIRKFIETEMVSKDTLALRKDMKENIPNIDLSFSYNCQNCGHEERMDVPLTVNFFWPS